MNEGEYKYWHTQVQGHSEATAAAMWQRALASPQVVKRGTPDAPRVPVDDMPRTVFYKGRELQHKLQRDSAVNSAREADTAMAGMANMEDNADDSGGVRCCQWVK